MIQRNLIMYHCITLILIIEKSLVYYIRNRYLQYGYNFNMDMIYNAV